MSYLSDIFSFEKSKLGNMWGKIKDNPEQLLLGAGDPFSAKVWGKITGKDYEPLVDQYGGATPYDYEKAKAEGIDTDAGRSMHSAARLVGGIYTGKWLGGLLPGSSAGAGAGVESAAGAGAESAAGAAGAQGGGGGLLGNKFLRMGLSQIGGGLGKQAPAPSYTMDPIYDNNAWVQGASPGMIDTNPSKKAMIDLLRQGGY